MKTKHEGYDRIRFILAQNSDFKSKWAYKKIMMLKKSVTRIQTKCRFFMVQPSDLLKFRISWFHGPSLRHPGHPHQFPTTLETCPNHPLGGEGYSNLTLPWEQQQATCPNTWWQHSFYVYICMIIYAARSQQVGNDNMKHTYTWHACHVLNYIINIIFITYINVYIHINTCIIYHAFWC